MYVESVPVRNLHRYIDRISDRNVKELRMSRHILRLTNLQTRDGFAYSHVYDQNDEHLNFDVALDIFDKTVVPILTYGSEKNTA